jgi:NAD(P)H-dependent FMN reductase
MTTPRILAFAGATRNNSWNKKLIRLGAESVRRAGGEVTLIDLRDVAMPLYDGDLEAQGGLPAGALALKGLMLEHDGFLISAPEYNSSISAVLKNAIDWVSRPQPNEPPAPAFRGKVAGCWPLPGASAGSGLFPLADPHGQSTLRSRPVQAGGRECVHRRRQPEGPGQQKTVDSQRAGEDWGA